MTSPGTSNDGSGPPSGSYTRPAAEATSAARRRILFSAALSCARTASDSAMYCCIAVPEEGTGWGATGSTSSGLRAPAEGAAGDDLRSEGQLEKWPNVPIYAHVHSAC